MTRTALITTSFFCAAVLIGIPTQSHAENIQGFGNSAPLSDATTLITPQGWSAKFTTPTIKKTPVSWSSGDGWEETLKKIATKNDLKLTINPSTKTVIIAPGSETLATPATSTEEKTNQVKKVEKKTRKHHRKTEKTYEASNSKSRYKGANETWRGGTRFDSPTIYAASPGMAQAMTIPVQGSPLGQPQPLPNTSTQQAQSSLAMQQSDPKFGQTYVPSRPVLPTSEYTLGYNANSGSGRIWTARSGETVDQIITRWASQSGEHWQVFSDKSHQPLFIRANISIQGSFTDAVRELTEDYHGTVTPVVSAHESPVGNIVTITDSEHASPSTD